jgi:hypothetical protein
MNMKKELVVLLFVLFSMGANAQFELPVYFEEPEEDTSWTLFANGGNTPESFILAENPDKSGINPSDFCILFTVAENADPWAGAYSDAYGEIEITGENPILQMMVYKDVISDCVIKLELGTDVYEVRAPNTETGVWELLSFDFSAVIGKIYTRLVFFPDFPATRTAGSICYIDNIGFEGTFDFGTSLKEKSRINFSIYPNPAKEKIAVQSEGINRIAITNLTGQNVKSFQFQKSDYEVLDVSDLVRGIYFLTVESSAGTVSSKFAKE